MHNIKQRHALHVLHPFHHFKAFEMLSMVYFLPPTVTSINIFHYHYTWKVTILLFIYTVYLSLMPGRLCILHLCGKLLHSYVVNSNGQIVPLVGGFQLHPAILCTPSFWACPVRWVKGIFGNTVCRLIIAQQHDLYIVVLKYWAHLLCFTLFAMQLEWMVDATNQLQRSTTQCTIGIHSMGHLRTMQGNTCRRHYYICVWQTRASIECQSKCCKKQRY